MRTILRYIAIVLALTPASAEAQDAGSAVVSSVDLGCVLDHADVYLDTPHPLIVIFLALCPNASPSPADLAALTQNSGGPSPPRLVNGEQAVTMLTLPRRKMVCLSDLYADGALDEVLTGDVVDLDALC